MKVQIFIILTALKGLFFPLSKDIKEHGFQKGKLKVQMVAKLDASIKESSGLLILSDSTLLTMNDGGNPAELFEVGLDGDLHDKYEFKQKNRDWESLAKDSLGNIYVADVGNNGHKRRNLAVLKYDSVYNYLGSIKFKYEDQTEFPPHAKENRRFDCEGVVWHNDSLFLFSKNWDEKTMRAYCLPSQVGEYDAKVVNQFRLSGMITGADISPSGDKLALLSYGYIYLFEIGKGMNDLKPIYVNHVGKMGQSEAIAFLSENELLVTNERGKLFKLKYRQ